MSRVVRDDTAFTGTAGRRKRPREKDGGHLNFIRSLPCVVTGRRPVEAAHVRYGDLAYGKPDTGKGEKPDDCWTVPLYWEEHARQHRGNERDYWKTVGIDPLRVALALYRATGDEEMGLGIVRRARKSAGDQS